MKERRRLGALRAAGAVSLSLFFGVAGSIAFAEDVDAVSPLDAFTKETEMSENSCSKPGPSPCSLPTDDAELRKILSPEQYRITKENGTERPFANEYWNNKRPGIYVDVISGDPLFSSTDKFDSGTGWPSFTKPIKPDAVVERRDASHGMVRTEVRSSRADSHLGHVFDDGPKPSGLRYCINSGSLRFVPVEDLEKNGLGELRSMFDAKK